MWRGLAAKDHEEVASTIHGMKRRHNINTIESIKQGTIREKSRSRIGEEATTHHSVFRNKKEG